MMPLSDEIISNIQISTILSGELIAQDLPGLETHESSLFHLGIIYRIRISQRAEYAKKD